MNIKMFLIVIGLTFLLNLGDYFIKVATLSKYPILWLMATCLCWTVSIPGWYYTFTKENLSLICMLFAVLSLITTTLIGMCLFHEKLACTEWIGFILALIATILLGSRL